MTKLFDISTSGNADEKSCVVTLTVPYGERDQKSVEVRFLVEAYPRDYQALDVLVDQEYARIMEVLSNLKGQPLRVPRLA